MKKTYQTSLFQSFQKMLICFSLLIISSTAYSDDVSTPPPSSPVEGHLVFTGSIALGNLISELSQQFSEYHPLVTITIASPGSMAGVNALISGSADMVLVSTPLSDKQKQHFKERFGYLPEIIPVAMDAVAIYVNNLNPLTYINHKDLDAIFSDTHRCGKEQSIKTWGDLGVKSILSQRQIHTYGLTIDTGATDLFRQVALCGGDFIKDFQALPGPAAIEEALTSDYAGIAFSNSALRSSELHALAISFDDNMPPIAPNEANIRSKRYPMSRTLSIVINHPVNQPIPAPLQAFINFTQSEQGKDIIRKEGYITLP